MGKPICIQIVNKAGTIVVVPTAIWENGLKLDPDWKVYVLPVLKAVVPVPVEMATIKVVKPARPIKPVPPPVVHRRKK